MATHPGSAGDGGSIAGSSTLPSTSSPTTLVMSSSTMSGGEFRMTQGQSQMQMSQQKANNFEPLDKSCSNTLKRNPKMELSKTDLLKLLGYLEGELQARDIVIAALKSEKMKHLLNSRYRSGTSDPHVALARDFAIVGGVIHNDNDQMNEKGPNFNLFMLKQKVSQKRMAKMLEDTEIRHRAVIEELEEEKRKHEHDTAQGDDITYGLEKERTRLKKELELERQEKKRLEMELKKESLALEMEKSRQKQIVLLLLAERKKIIMKYIEERKRSEDLAQILSEEKVRIDSMAEGLEEESKKSLQMEAELEKQLAQFDMERQQYRQALTKEEKKSKEFEMELERMKAELESWKSGAAIRGGIRAPLGATPPPPPAKPANLAAMPTLRPAGVATQALKGAPVLGTGTPMVSSKVVQPTATVTSVPVSGPTTGIARSVTPRQVMRGVTYGSAVAPASIGQATSPPVTGTIANDSTAPVVPSQGSVPPGPVVPANIITAGPQNSGDTNTPAPEPQTSDKRVVTNEGKGTPSASTLKSSFHGGTVAGSGKKPLVPRGMPPPVPPNKPVVPPKKEAAYMRRPDPNQPLQDTLKIGKQGTCQGVTQTQPPAQPSSPIPTHQQIPDETKPR
ncbi:CTTNBP2 N-terminal-like protein isoform X1 [Diachasmimorpha longicaudata]|uniref:CTTNBP2 N-terminal-like protein isoform X1 n=1 Tax=Diachasmimorpha longicaudata TaxID=58733 RepID=UPI0030B8C459